MSTRALIKLYDKVDCPGPTMKNLYFLKPFATLYCHGDGYPNWLGKELAEICIDKIVVNGLSIQTNDTPNTEQANGAHCLAATIIKELKRGPGDTYLYHPDTKDMDEEWIYHVLAEADHPIRIDIWDVYNEKLVFQGTPEAMLKWIDTFES